jgi:hypothetical protein
MLESGSSGSVRGVPSNVHPYRDPGPIAAVALGSSDGEVKWQAAIHAAAGQPPNTASPIRACGGLDDPWIAGGPVVEP